MEVLPYSHSRLGGALCHHTMSGRARAAPAARLRTPMATDSESTAPTIERGVAPSARITANSRRRSNVAISMVFATPKTATVNTTARMIQ